MAIKVNWKSNAEYSPLYAAAMLCSGQSIADSRLLGVIGDATETIRDRLAVADIETDRFWSHLIAVGNKGKSERGRVENALMAAGCGTLAADSLSPTISGQLVDLKFAFGEAYPKLEEQLPLRARPLKEQWEAIGPGLMAMVAKFTHRDLMVKRCTIALVQPVCGAGGGVSPEAGLAWIEAVLANPYPSIPEVLRLAWFIARLGLARANANKLVDSSRLPDVVMIGLLPIMIEAGRELGIAQDADIETLVSAWYLRKSLQNGGVQLVENWWQQMQDGEIPFPVGMKALERMLYPS